LFIMAEKSVMADKIGAFLRENHDYGFKPDEVLIIHTDTKGDIQKGDLEEARQAARDIDLERSKVKVIVSVMMLREGWDVKNVSVVLGLRPFTAASEILPEQVIGRGLRLMQGIGPDRTQTLEVLGTRKLLQFLKDELESEGVGVGVSKQGPKPPVTIYPVQERFRYDIAIPLTKPSVVYDVTKLSQLDVGRLTAVYDQEELADSFRVKLRMEFATTETMVHEEVVQPVEPPIWPELLSVIARRVQTKTARGLDFHKLVPVVSRYVATRCFGKRIDPELQNVRSHLHRHDMQEAIAAYLASAIAQLTVERKALEFERADFKLSLTHPFTWRRDLPPLEARKTVFNYVATFNKFERRFAEFLDLASDVSRFAALGTTEQGDSGSEFKIDYLKPSGAVGYYHPDWAVVQRAGGRETFWIIETKGRLWADTGAKDRAMAEWCRRVSEKTGDDWRFKRIDQVGFDGQKPKTLAEAVLISSA